jgi:hypothetical protein
MSYTLQVAWLAVGLEYIIVLCSQVKFLGIYTLLCAA